MSTQTTAQKPIKRKKVSWLKIVSLVMSILPLIVEALDDAPPDHLGPVAGIFVNRDTEDPNKLVLVVLENGDGDNLARKTGKMV